MNPVTVSIPSPPRMVNDVAGPVPAPVAPPAAPTATTNVVANIPVHTQAAPAAPVNEDEELDKIMHDVGQEMKKEDKKPAKHHLFGLGHKTQKPAVASATVIPQPPSRPLASAPPMPVQAPVQPRPAPPAPQVPAVSAAAVKPTSQRSVPVFVIFVAFLVTGFLMAAAIAAYRQT